MAASDSGADGGICFTGDQPPTADNVKNTFPSDPGIDNIVSRPDLTKIAPDLPGDNDYDDPYPGGATASLGLPLDG
jgi:hypothetical protein